VVSGRIGCRCRRGRDRLVDSPVETPGTQFGRRAEGGAPRQAITAKGTGAVALACTLTTLALLAGLFGGCAYKPLKAPCSADEDAASIASRAGDPTQPLAAFASLAPCGPMRTI
jgi:hypothetical protein